MSEIRDGLHVRGEIVEDIERAVAAAAAEAQQAQAGRWLDSGVPAGDAVRPDPRQLD